MRSLLCFLYLFYGILGVGFSQSYEDPNTVSLPSANNKFSASTTAVDLHLYSGAASIKFPLYELASRQIKYPLGMQYIASQGVRNQDVPGFVGLGWQFTGVGNISRVVRSRPDEIDSGYLGSLHFGQTLASASGTPGGLTADILKKVGTGQFDGEPDIFHVSTPFFDFQFTFDANGIPIFPNSSGFVIQHNLYGNLNYFSTYFIITDDEGNKYYFGSSDASREKVTSKLFDKSAQHISTWYLDKIENFESGDQITFSYLSGPDYTVTHYLSSKTTFETSPTCTVSDIARFAYTSTFTYNSPKYLSTITSALGQISLSYNYNRSDIPGSLNLGSVIVYPFHTNDHSISAPIKTFYFNYSYFGAPSSNPDALRLRLDNITVLGSATVDAITAVYKSFDYNTNYNLPIRGSVEFDYMGFYNTNTSGTALVPTAIKAPDVNRAQANILTAIHDVSGEIVKFQYELNVYHDFTSNLDKMLPGLRIAKVTRTTASGENLYTQYLYTNPSGTGSSGQVNNDNYLNFSKSTNILYLSNPPCGINGTTTSSESMYSSADLNGNYIGYSSVKVVNQNGGFEINSFTNFSDFPDTYSMNNSDGSNYSTINNKQLSAYTSYAYKRGLLINQATYNSAGVKIQETQNTYLATTAVASKSFALKATAYTYIPGANVTNWVYGKYVANVENYLLKTTKHITYDQNNAAISSPNLTTYTYSPDNRLVRKIDYVDYRGLSKTKTSFYVDDIDINSLPAPEIAAVTAMKSANKVSAAIHTIDLDNGNSTYLHYSYQRILDATRTLKTLLVKKTFYLNSNPLQRNTIYQYDVDNNTQTSSSLANGPVHSTSFGANNSYIYAKVENALNTVSYTTSPTTATTSLNVPGGSQGTFHVGFTSNYSGSITVSILAGSYLGGTGSITLSGVASVSGVVVSNANLCISNVNACSSSNTPSSYTFTNMPAGDYSFDFYILTNSVGTQSTPQLTVTYPAYQMNLVSVPEFFYEGFEDALSATAGIAHTGKYYWNSSYSIPYTPPNARTYILQYWSLVSGVWVFHQQTYAGSVTIPGPVDDIRVFPSDAAMTTYAYNPLVGIIGSVDPSGQTTTYEYDAMGRLALVRNGDRNILKKFEYKFQTLVVPQ